MRTVIASLHGAGPGLDIKVGDTTFENVDNVELAEQVSFIISGDAGINLDEKICVSDEVAVELINLLNGEASK